MSRQSRSPSANNKPLLPDSLPLHTSPDAIPLFMGGGGTQERPIDVSIKRLQFPFPVIIFTHSPEKRCWLGKVCAKDFDAMFCLLTHPQSD